MFHKNAKVLCLSPHPDDIEFGLGACLHKYRSEIEAYVVTFSDRSRTRGESNNDEDQRAAAATLGIKPANVFFIDELDGTEFRRLPIRMMGTESSRDVIRAVVTHCVQRFDPSLIFVPAISETMQDHQAMAEETVRIVRGNVSIFGYETTKHNRYVSPIGYVRVDQEDIDAKVRAINQYSEFTTRYYFDAKMIEGLASTRASHAGFSGYAEAFEPYRIFQQ